LAGPGQNSRRKKKHFNENQLRLLPNLVVIGDEFSNDEGFLHDLFEVHPFPGSNEQQRLFIDEVLSKPRSLPVFLYLEKGKTYRAGMPEAWLAGRSYEYFLRAVDLVQALQNASLITLPVSKENILRSGVDFYGHTEELERLFGVKTIMCMYHPELSIIPLTNHIALKDVPDAVQKTDANSLAGAILFLQALTGFTKKNAMTGLNPHAGEHGKIGNEEEFLTALIGKMQKAGVEIEGPLPADGLFMPANRSRCSVIIAAYHDQALIPFKALFGTSGLNITLNLPILRVSPAHGTAYEIAGKSEADIQSVYNSLVFAMQTGEKWIKQYSCPS